MIFFTALLTAISAPHELKQSTTRQLGIESFQEAVISADELVNFQDPEGIYLAVQAYSNAKLSEKAIALLEAHKQLLQDSNYYKKCLESVSLSVFKSHFQSTQEYIKLAAINAISLQSDARVLDLLLEALNSSSLKIKIAALRGLRSFADEKVKITLLQTFKTTTHPVLRTQISELFMLWQDKRILPYLYKILNDDGVTTDEKINYIIVIKELSKDFDIEKISKLVFSEHISEKLLACYLLSIAEVEKAPHLIIKLLNDTHLWVKQAALMAVIKKKISDPAVSKIILSWKMEKSIELVKGYYYYGIVNHNKNIIDDFLSAYKSSPEHMKKRLASMMYYSGVDQEDLINQLLDNTHDPYIKLQLGLYLVGGPSYTKGVDLIYKALEASEGKKINLVGEPIYPFFSIGDESNSSVAGTAGQRRAEDKHLRLQVFRLLAIKKLPQAKDVLKQLLKSDLFDVSSNAMVHFWENFGYEDSEYLKEILKDQDPELRLKAALVLSRLDYDQDIRKFLMESFHKQTCDMQVHILYALSKYHEDDILDFYVKNLKSKYPLIQAVSAGCLFTAIYN